MPGFHSLIASLLGFLARRPCPASMPSCLASWPMVLPCTWFFLEPQVYDHPIGRGKTLYQLTVRRVKMPVSHLSIMTGRGVGMNRMPMSRHQTDWRLITASLGNFYQVFGSIPSNYSCSTHTLIEAGVTERSASTKGLPST